MTTISDDIVNGCADVGAAVVARGGTSLEAMRATLTAYEVWRAPDPMDVSMGMRFHDGDELSDDELDRVLALLESGETISRFTIGRILLMAQRWRRACAMEDKRNESTP